MIFDNIIIYFKCKQEGRIWPVIVFPLISPFKYAVNCRKRVWVCPKPRQAILPFIYLPLPPLLQIYENCEFRDSMEYFLKTIDDAFGNQWILQECRSVDAHHLWIWTWNPPLVILYCQLSFLNYKVFGGRQNPSVPNWSRVNIQIPLPLTRQNHNSSCYYPYINTMILTWNGVFLFYIYTYIFIYVIFQHIFVAVIYQENCNSIKI